jgi:hypothetical protein
MSRACKSNVLAARAQKMGTRRKIRLRAVPAYTHPLLCLSTLKHSKHCRIGAVSLYLFTVATTYRISACSKSSQSLRSGIESRRKPVLHIRIPNAGQNLVRCKLYDTYSHGFCHRKLENHYTALLDLRVSDLTSLTRKSVTVKYSSNFVDGSESCMSLRCSYSRFLIAARFAWRTWFPLHILLNGEHSIRSAYADLFGLF